MVVPYGRVNFLGPGSGEVWAWDLAKEGRCQSHPGVVQAPS